MAYLLTDVLRLTRQELEDAGEATWTDAQLEAAIQNTLPELSDACPYEDLETVTLTELSPFVDVSTIDNLIEVIAAYYPVTDTHEYWKNKRNVTRFGNQIRIEMDARPSGDDEEAYLECEKLHTLTELTSTLSNNQAIVLAIGAAARAAMSWVNRARPELVEVLSRLDTAITSIEEMGSEASGRIKKAIDDLGTGAGQIDDVRTTADGVIDNMTARIGDATDDLIAGRLLINKVNIGANPANLYAGYAARELNSASELLMQARGYFAEHTTADKWRAFASTDLAVASASLNKAVGYIRAITSQVNTVRVMSSLLTWAQIKQNEFRTRLASITKQRTYQLYSRD